MAPTTRPIPAHYVVYRPRKDERLSAETKKVQNSSLGYPWVNTNTKQSRKMGAWRECKLNASDSLVNDRVTQGINDGRIARQPDATAPAVQYSPPHPLHQVLETIEC